MMHVKGQREAVVFGYALAIAALLCIAGYVSSGGCGHTSTGADTAGTVKVPLSKLKELRSLIDKQEQRLEQLETLLGGQSSKLSGQQSSISQLRQELATAKSSLANSKLIIDEQNSSLMSLSESINQEKRRTKRIERQRIIWQIIAGSAILYITAK